MLWIQTHSRMTPKSYGGRPMIYYIFVLFLTRWPQFTIGNFTFGPLYFNVQWLLGLTFIM